MKILLIMPHASERVFRPGPPPPLTLLSIAAVLREAGHEPEIIDLSLLQSPEAIDRSEFCISNVLRMIKDSHLGMVGINCFTSGRFPFIRQLADSIKQNCPSLPIIIGGMHPTLFYREILEHCLSIDAVVIGEGEWQSVALAEAYSSGKVAIPESLQKIDALAFRDGDGQIVCNPRKEYIQDIDSLPMPAWDLLHFEDYYADYSNWHNPRGLKINMSVPIYTSRSCPFDCNFCSSHNLMGRGLRLRSPIRVVDEMEMLYETYGQNYFGFIDDNLVVHKEHILAICNEIIRRGMAIQFESPVGYRINSLDEEIIDAMVRAGCTYFILPIEHGNARIRNKIVGKKLSRDKIFEVVKICKRYNVLTGTSCIMGFPEDTQETLAETVKLFNELQLDIANVHNLVPFPGTKIFDQAVHEDLFFDSIDLDSLWDGTWVMDATESHFYIKPYKMSLDELNEYREKFDDLRLKYFRFDSMKRNLKAKVEPRINLENRTRLEKAIPLSTPMILYVDPASTCNFKCKFCPTGNHELIKETGRWQGLMNFGLYKKIIDDLKEFDEPLKVLRLYKDGEPLLNKQFTEMVYYAKKSRMVNYIDTTTNGYLLELEKIKPVLDAGLDRINISVDGMSDEQFLKFTGVKVNFKKFVENIRNLYKIKGDCEVCIKITGDFMSEEEKKRFFDTFGSYADRIFVENVAPCWPEFDTEKRLGIKITKGIYGQPIGDVNTCPYIFYSISVNSDGSVSLCFLDWARKLLIGDVRKQSLKEIWQGDSLFQYQLEHLRGKRKENAVCGQCGQLSHCMPDNINPYVDTIAERLLASRQG